jgi:Tol biopolymer transport system component
VSRDGQWIAFDSDRQGNPDIYRMPAAGGETQQVTTDPSFDFIPTWSPDGKRIAFQSWRNENRDIFVINADGTGETLVAGGPDMEMYADWSADGKALVFYSNRTGANQVYITRETAPGQWSEPHRLTQDGEGGVSPRWAPDGSLISYLGRSGVEVIAPDGSGHRVLISDASLLAKRLATLPADGPEFAVWSADSKTVIVKITVAGHATFWTVPAAGGAPRMVARFENPSFAGSRQEFASDGKRIFFTADDRQSDIKVMEVRP